MRLPWTLAQTLEVLAAAQDLTPLLGQRGEGGRDLVLSRHTEVHHLLGFLTRWRPAQRRQTHRNTSGIVGRTHAMAFGHPKEGFDGIGTDRQAELIES
jgi:hypothetical protein